MEAVSGDASAGTEPLTSTGERDSSQGVSVFCPGGARPPGEAMIASIDDHREAYGIEPICKVLPIAPSTYHAHIAQRVDASKRVNRLNHEAGSADWRDLHLSVRPVFPGQVSLRRSLRSAATGAKLGSVRDYA